MKHKLYLLFWVIFSLLLFNFKTFGDAIIYDIYHYPEKLHIVLQFTGNKEGVTEINVLSNIWGHDLSKQIKNIHILGENIVQKDPNTLLHNSNQLIKLEYDIVNLDIPNKYSSFYTKCEKEGFFFLHDFALVYPKVETDQETLLRYHSKVNKFFCLSEKTEAGSEISTSLQRLKGGISVAGNNSFLKVGNLGDGSYILGSVKEI